MNMLTLLLAAALSAGNAEFDRTAIDGAQTVAFRRVEAEILARGPEVGKLKEMMLADTSAFANAQKAKELGREHYLPLVVAELAAAKKAIAARLGLSAADGVELPKARADEAMARFESYYAAERKAACAEQAKGLAGTIRPPEAEFESKDDATLRREMTDKVAAQQKGGVFEENLKYISETIVDPVIADAKREMKRQREYLSRTKCESYAPSALGRELEAHLRKNVAERQAKTDDPAKAWGVFPRTLAAGVPEVVERRTLERVTRCADDVPVAVDADSISAAIERDPKAHRNASDSERIFDTVFASAVLEGAIGKAIGEAPAKEREEFAAYVRGHAADSSVDKAVSARIRRELLPELRKVRGEIAQADLVRGWPQLADGTWYPDAELADAIAARSDYQRAVRGWRTLAELSGLSLAGAKAVRLAETDALADRAVADAFNRARNAIAAQNAILTAATPGVLGEAKDRKSSFWRATPDFKKIVELLTEAVEDKWNAARVETLWPDEGMRPANADEQHAAIFPSVRRRIELIAKSILEEMEKPEVKPEEKKPEPEERPKEPSEPEQPTKEEQLMEFSIVVQRTGDEITVKLEQGKTTVEERSVKAKMSAYRGAMKAVSDKLGTEILKLK